MQAALFLTPIVIISFLALEITLELARSIFAYLVFMPVVLAFLLGYVMRDIGNSIKALMLSQLFGWFLIVVAFAANSDRFRTFLVSSNPSRVAGFDILLMTGLGIFAILVGIPASALGGFLGGFIEGGRRGARTGAA